MGRVLLFIVAALSLAGIAYSVTQQDVRGQQVRSEVDVQHATLAQTAARSAFDAALGSVLGDLDARPTAAERDASADGDYGRTRVTASDTPHGTVRLLAQGRYERAGHVIEADVLELLPVGAAVYVDASEAKVEIDGGFVSGLDRRVPGAGGDVGGPAGARPAVGFRDAALRAEIQSDWGSEQWASLEGAGPTAVAPTPSETVALIDAVLAAPTTQRRTALELKHEVVGTPAAPVAVHVAGDAKLEQGARGVGVLIVDGDLKMTRDARWEGLIVVRAEANDKRKVEITDDATLYGALVLRGTEFLEESSGSDGFPGGHMDLDLFSGSGIPLDRDYHQHEWDDRYDLTWLDFFHGPDIGASFTAFHDERSAETLRVEFANAHSAAGTYAIGSTASATTGRIEDGFDAAVPFASLSLFQVRFDALCTLRGTSPGRVKDDGVARDDAFTVRFWDGADLVYAVSAYEHADLLRDGDPTCSGGAGTTEHSDAYGTFELKVKERASVYYSEEALGRVGRGVPAVRAHSRAFPVFLRNVSVPR